jgi:hypothetical protein
MCVPACLPACRFSLNNVKLKLYQEYQASELKNQRQPVSLSFFYSVVNDRLYTEPTPESCVCITCRENGTVAMSTVVGLYDEAVAFLEV